MNKAYTNGTTITAILEALAMPNYALPAYASKLRFNEPYVTEGQNWKDSGIVPTGIYHGFTPNAIGGNILRLDVDPIRLDSVAVVETRLGRYNLTVRETTNISLDFTAYATFPRLVVLRTIYSLTSNPLSGLTTSEILVVDPVLNDASADSLNTGDVKICRVTGVIAGVVQFTVVSGTDRDDTGGGLVTINQLITAGASIVGQQTLGANFSVPAGTHTIPGGIATPLSLAIPGFSAGQLVCINFTGTVGPSAYITLGVGVQIDGVEPILPGACLAEDGSSPTGGGRGNIAFSVWTNVTAGSHTFAIRAGSNFGATLFGSSTANYGQAPAHMQIIKFG